LLNAMAGLLARFYDHPELGSVLQVLAACFLFVPFSSPIIALMRREMEFRTIAVINIVATAAGAAATIAFAWFGFSSLRLALAALVAAAGTAAMALALRPGLVRFRPAVAVWRRVIGFGGYASATTLLNTLYELLPPMVLGRVL